MSLSLSLVSGSVPSLPLVALALEWEALVRDTGIPLALMGIVVVFGALILVALFIAQLPRLVAWIELRMSSSSTASQSAPCDASQSEELSPETVVVLAAAVADAIVEPHRIVHARHVTDVEFGWAVQGRQRHHFSHRTRGSW